MIGSFGGKVGECDVGVLIIIKYLSGKAIKGVVVILNLLSL